MLANAPSFLAAFVITDPTRLWIQLDMAEQDLPTSAGTDDCHSCARFPLRHSKARSWWSLIFSIPRPERSVRGVVENPERLLKAEMFVMWICPAMVRRPDISLKAVFSKARDICFLEEGRGQFARREIKVGPEHEGKILVLDGIQPGQRVVTDGCLLLEQMLQAAEGS